MRKYICIAFYLLLVGLKAHAQQADQVDSLKRALQGAREDTLKIAILSDLSFAYVNSSPDTAMAYWQQQMKLAEKVNLPKFIANAFNDLAIIQYYQGDNSNALLNNQKALQIREKLGDPALILSSLSKIGVIYQETGNNDKALETQLRVLKIAEQLHNETNIGITLHNISYFYRKIKRYDEAMRYLDRAMAIARKEKDTLRMANVYTSIESIFEDKGMVDSAYRCQATAIDLYQRINSLSELSKAYNDMGYLCRLLRRNKEGLYYYKKALEIAIKLDNQSDKAFYAANIGSTYMDLKRPDSGFQFLKLAMADSTPITRRTVYGAMASYFILKARPDSALHYNELYRDILDTIYTATNASQLSEMLTRYETEKKEQQIVLLNKQNTIKQLTIDRKNITISAIAGAFIIAALLGALLYDRYRTRQEVRLQEEIIRQQHMASKAVIAAEELERKRIAGDLHDGIGQMFSAVKLNLSGIADRVSIPNEADRHLLDKTLALVDESCKEVRVIAHQMMPNILLRTGLTAAIRDFIDKIDENKLKITLETFGLQQPLDSNTETVLYRIIQESVNNVIRHARATMLDIQLHKDKEGINVTIEDNGIGFDLAQLTEGVGLKSIQARAAFLEGKVEYDTAPGKGTVVAVFIPNRTA